MDLMKIAADLFLAKLGRGGGQLDLGQVQQALGALLGGKNGQIDLADIVARFSGGGFPAMAQSWLADGPNDDISPQQVLSTLGEGEVADFAGRLGLGKEEAAGGLAAMLPELIDKCSRGGSLLDAVGGANGLLGAASKLFK